MMPTGNCVACKFWIKREDLEKMGLGECAAVKKWFDVTECDAENEDVFMPEFKETKAVVVDGSGYKSELLTMPDFGCTAYAGKT